jgi:mRNA-degrading endonuclease RelE of RelBE toxin-antitoxin system
MNGSKECKILLLPSFEQEANRLAKRYSSLREDIAGLRSLLILNPKTGTSLGGGVYKIRLAIKSKGKGKRSGARIISLYFERDSELFLLSIYDKSDQATIPDARVRALVNEAVEYHLRRNRA